MLWLRVKGVFNLIILDNVTKIYENSAVGIKNVNLKIKEGEFVFIVGNTGSGKSTMLRLLLKEIEPTNGTIVIGDKNITRMSKEKIPYFRRQLGVVFQDFKLFENKTVFENVAFAMKVIEEPSKNIRRTVPNVLSTMGLESKARCYPKQLSGGEKQRTAIGRAILNHPSILLADEPTGNLDPKTSWDIMKVLEEINSNGTTIIVVTHNQEIVNSMQKRVIQLQDGRVIRDVVKGGYKE